MRTIASIAAILALVAAPIAQDKASDSWVVYPGGDGPGAGKHIVLIAGDEEYRSEEAMPMLGRILSVRHGFRCTVLFSTNPETGEIDPTNQTHITGMSALDDADMMVVFLRFRELPDEDMAHFDAFVQSGKPILGLRTATHAFNIKRDKNSAYAKYDFRHKKWPGGFGQQVLGDTWINHHGSHKHESTRGVINKQYENHPILRGVVDIWGPTDVYGVRNLVEEAQVLVHGQVLQGILPSDPPVEGAKNEPMMPLVWTKGFEGTSGVTSRVICTTMGSSTDMESAGLRRLLVNACYWGLGLEDQIGKQGNVEYVGKYAPTPYGFGGFTKGVMPADHRLPSKFAPASAKLEPMSHAALRELSGTKMAGKGELWLDPTGNEAILSDCSIAITDTEVTYAWSYEGKPQQGRFTMREGGATFSDTWHQPQPMKCEDLANSWALLDLTSTYSAGGGPDWGWRTTLSRRPTGEIVMQMTNITPWGEHGRAVRMVFAPQ